MDTVDPVWDSCSSARASRTLKVNKTKVSTSALAARPLTSLLRSWRRASMLVATPHPEFLVARILQLRDLVDFRLGGVHLAGGNGLLQQADLLQQGIQILVKRVEVLGLVVARQLLRL